LEYIIVTYINAYCISWFYRVNTCILICRRYAIYNIIFKAFKWNITTDCPYWSSHIVSIEIIGYNVTLVRQFLKEGRKRPMYMVTLPGTTDSNEIFNLDSLRLHQSRAVPNYQPAQVFACQGFGHTSSYCSHIARCVTFGDNHTTKSCTNTPDQPSIFWNCNGEHSANYRKCPAYTKAASLIRNTL